MRGGGLPSAIKTKSEPDPPKRLRLAAIPDDILLKNLPVGLAL
jgi:hypothetical protein